MEHSVAFNPAEELKPRATGEDPASAEAGWAGAAEVVARAVAVEVVEEEAAAEAAAVDVAVADDASGRFEPWDPSQSETVKEELRTKQRLAMHHFKNSTKSDGYRYTDAILALAFCLLASRAIAATSSGQQVFPSAAAAAKALVGAARIDDMAALSSILGGGAKEVLSSGDPVADNSARDNFVAKYDQMERLAYNDQGRVVLYLGADNWPFPIPLVKRGDGWVFDTEAGKRELLYRRVGRNELYTIDVLADLADAQEEYASEIRDNGSVKQFAQKIQSAPGKRDGLYWPVSSEEEESPIGPLIADATAEGYKTGAAASIPFHGYYYRILSRQGKNAPGGAKDYLVDGKMTQGFAIIAYPANYRASGVMTFMINQDGVIVQKDLGTDTAKAANKITEYNPDATWQEVDD